MHTSRIAHYCALEPKFRVHCIRRRLSSVHLGRPQTPLTAGEVPNARFHRHRVVAQQPVQNLTLVRFESTFATNQPASAIAQSNVSEVDASDFPRIAQVEVDASRSPEGGIPSTGVVGDSNGGAAQVENGKLDSINVQDVLREQDSSSQPLDVLLDQASGVSQHHSDETQSPQSDTARCTAQLQDKESGLQPDLPHEAHARQLGDEAKDSAGVDAATFIDPREACQIVQQKFQPLSKKNKLAEKIHLQAMSRGDTAVIGSPRKMIWIDCPDFAYLVKPSQRLSKGKWVTRDASAAWGLKGQGKVEFVFHHETGTFYLGTYNCGPPQELDPEEFKKLPERVRETVVSRSCETRHKNAKAKAEVMRLYEKGSIRAAKFPLRRVGYNAEFDAWVRTMATTYNKKEVIKQNKEENKKRKEERKKSREERKKSKELDSGITLSLEL